MQTTERVLALIKTGEDLSNYEEIQHWILRSRAFVESAFDANVSNRFNQSIDKEHGYREKRAVALGLLEAEAAKLTNRSELSRQESVKTSGIANTNDVFVVHGHDSEAKESAARFISKLGLNPIILHEQANKGRTVIEKFEAHSNVAFAVILLTPDDTGGARNGSPSPRARQNVILELGYFLGKLGRNRVCALYKNSIELPTDISGVLYIALDDGGAWKARLAQELVQAGITIKLDALLSG